MTIPALHACYRIHKKFVTHAAGKLSRTDGITSGGSSTVGAVVEAPVKCEPVRGEAISTPACRDAQNSPTVVSPAVAEAPVKIMTPPSRRIC